MTVLCVLSIVSSATGQIGGDYIMSWSTIDGSNDDVDGSEAAKATESPSILDSLESGLYAGAGKNL